MMRMTCERLTLKIWVKVQDFFLFIVKIDRVSVTDVSGKRCVKSNKVIFEI